MNKKQRYQWVKRESKRWPEVGRHFRETVVVVQGRGGRGTE